MPYHARWLCLMAQGDGDANNEDGEADREEDGVDVEEVRVRISCTKIGLIHT